MRDPKRIDEFCNRLAKAWKRLPDWRFGQLMSNALGEFAYVTRRDIFFPEDNEMIEFLEDYIRKNCDDKCGFEFEICQDAKRTSEDKCDTNIKSGS